MKGELEQLDTIQTLREETRIELKEEILPYWIKLVSDEHNGGYIGRINGRNIREIKADRSGILNARILWTFSAAARVLKDPEYLKHAKRAFEYMENHFYDKINGGFYWSVDHEGNCVNEKKYVYAQAFAIYGYSEYARATGSEVALERALETFRLLENHARDETYGGYHEAFLADWTPLDDVRLSSGDANEPRSMNTHLHVMEAYANLYRAVQTEEVKESLMRVTKLVMTDIYDSESHHFDTFFDEKWNPRSNFYSYGHDIEAAWLLIDAAEALEDSEMKIRAQNVMRDVAEITLQEGVDPETGGVYFTGLNGKPVDTDFHWWVQAEAIAGFLYAYELIGEEKYLVCAERIWAFVESTIKDREHGEWFFRLNGDGDPYLKEDKVGPWKCPYHNSRLCLILQERFDEDFQSPLADESVLKNDLL